MNAPTEWMYRELDTSIEHHANPIIQKRKLQHIHSENLNLWAYREYKADNLLFRIATDRGLISVEITPASNPSLFRGLSAYRDLLDPPDQGRWNLSVTDSIQFLDEHWDEFQQILSPGLCEQTIKNVDTAARRAV